MARLSAREHERRADARRAVDEAHQSYRQAADALGWEIARCRQAGVSWADIGRTMGMDWRSARLIARRAGRAV